MKDKEIVKDTKSINEYVSDNIESALDIAEDQQGNVEADLHLPYYLPVAAYYQSHEFTPVWSDTAVFSKHTTRFILYLDTSISDGLFREAYHYQEIKELYASLCTDSLKQKDAVLWAKADLLLSDAFMHVAADLHQGRMAPDSLLYKNDTAAYRRFFGPTLLRFLQGEKDTVFFESLQPLWHGYRELKLHVDSFYRQMDTTSFTYIHFPFLSGNDEDSMAFISSLKKRLAEEKGLELKWEDETDTATLAKIILSYQKKAGLTTDGKLGPAVIRSLNLTDKVKFKRLLITLDRYKLLPDTVPVSYVWVNLPGFYLQTWSSDSLCITSRIICGKPITPTPILNSSIYEMVTYPTWTVPSSIIKKEMLPGLKKSPDYLKRKGLELFDHKGSKIDPVKVDWSKYKKGIPYQIRQDSGDDNALGVMKFNFRNPFDVYLHDTNQRYFFSRNMRALSHGCVRVQEWLPLAEWLIRNDSTLLAPKDSLAYTPDSVASWIAQKKKLRVPVKKRVPIFINYMSCESVNGQLIFYTDIYDEDSKMLEKYFATTP